METMETMGSCCVLADAVGCFNASPASKLGTAPSPKKRPSCLRRRLEISGNLRARQLLAVPSATTTRPLEHQWPRRSIFIQKLFLLILLRFLYILSIRVVSLSHKNLKIILIINRLYSFHKNARLQAGSEGRQMPSAPSSEWIYIPQILKQDAGSRIHRKHRTELYCQLRQNNN